MENVVTRPECFGVPTRPDTTLPWGGHPERGSGPPPPTCQDGSGPTDPGGRGGLPGPRKKVSKFSSCALYQKFWLFRQPFCPRKKKVHKAVFSANFLVAKISATRFAPSPKYFTHTAPLYKWGGAHPLLNRGSNPAHLPCYVTLLSGRGPALC